MPNQDDISTAIDTALSNLQTSLEERRYKDALRIFLALHLADQAQVFNLLEDLQKEELLKQLDIPSTADLFDELEDDETLEAAAVLSLDRLADVLDEMEPDEAADLLGDLTPEQATEALAQMDEPEDVLPLLGYPDETAGGRMTTSYIALRRNTRAEQAIEFLRLVSPESDVPYYLFVVDREKSLVGVVGLRELVIAPPDTLIHTIMNEDVIFITSEADQEEAARLMARYDLSALPVVDDQKRLLGVITHDDLVDVLEDEATEDIYRLANVSDTELEPESPIFEQIRGRLPWLYLSTFTALFAAWVISRFEDVIAQVAVLAVFQSVVAGLGGNSVSQNMALIVRAIALDKLPIQRLWPVIFRQMIVGILLGVFVGIVVGTGVIFWRGNLFLGIILCMALIGNMVVAGIAGTLIPLGLHAFGQDPALASSVLVTTATDSMGFLIFLGLARVFLPYLS